METHRTDLENIGSKKKKKSIFLVFLGGFCMDFLGKMRMNFPKNRVGDGFSWGSNKDFFCFHRRPHSIFGKIHPCLISEKIYAKPRRKTKKIIFFCSLCFSNEGVLKMHETYNIFLIIITQISYFNDLIFQLFDI